MARMSRKELKQDEIAEAASDAGEWLEENWQKAIQWAAIAAAVVLVVVVGIWWARSAANDKAERLADAQAAYVKAEASGFTDVDALSTALEGLEASEKETSGEMLAVTRYYKALVQQQLSGNSDAITTLEQVVGNVGGTLEASASSLLANLYVSEGRPADAISLLEKAVAEENGALPAPLALLQIARIHESNGERDAAESIWRTIRDEHADSSAALEARQKLGNS